MYVIIIHRKNKTPQGGEVGSAPQLIQTGFDFSPAMLIATSRVPVLLHGFFPETHMKNSCVPLFFNPQAGAKAVIMQEANGRSGHRN